MGIVEEKGRGIREEVCRDSKVESREGDERFVVENRGEQKLGRKRDEYMRKERGEGEKEKGGKMEKGREDGKMEIGRGGGRMQNGRMRG